MAGPTVWVGPMHRYEESAGFTSAFDPLDDLVLHLNFLTAKDYVVDLLVHRHSVSKIEAVRRAARIRPHVQLASRYVTQSRSGPADVAFVACYYAILNLIKVYILCSTQHHRLATNRLHGASYDPTGRLPRGLPSDKITLHTSGAIPLLYEVLVGRPVPSRMVVHMRDVYPCISDVGAEWQMASPARSRRVTITVAIDEAKGGRVPRYTVEGLDAVHRISVKHLPVLKNCKRVKGSDRDFVLSSTLPASASDHQALYAGIDRRFLYFPLAGHTLSVITPGRLLMPEELPVVLAFYHLSSVARYNPEFLERLASSKYWPVVAAMRAHGLYKFLLLFWSYMRMATVSVGR